MSPVYCDNRKVYSYVNERIVIFDALANMVEEKFPEANCVVGVASGAIGWGALVAHELELPFVYIRTEPKDHGMGNLIEGELRPGAKVVVIEDLISTGESSLKAVNAIKTCGLPDVEVVGLVAIFSYCMKEAEQKFAEAGCAFATTSTFPVLAAEAEASGYISKEEFEALQSWNENVRAWSEAYLEKQAK